jgi:murein DD-endopeptidase MepM/ murein hydrolase activator NlpD
MSLKRKRSIVYVTRDESGTVDRVAIPMRYVYVFVAAAITGMFTFAGLAGSYSRMLVKTESMNKLRTELAMTRTDYAHLEKKEHEKDVQVASLGSLASEVSAIYGLTAGKLTLPHGHGFGSTKKPVIDPKAAPLKDDSVNFTDDSYYRSLDTFYALRTTATTGSLRQQFESNLGVRSTLSDLASMDDTGGSNVPDMWPILGRVNDGFGQRVDPVLGEGVGEFHKGIDIDAPDGTPVHAPAAGRVLIAGMANGYGREIEVDHGNGIKTIYGHLSGFNVLAGQTVVKGQVIGYVGHSGKATGSHLHYEVQIHNTAVNPHKYLRTTMAQLGGGTGLGS